MPQVLSRYSAWAAASQNNYLPWFLHAKALNASSGDSATSSSRVAPLHPHQSQLLGVPSATRHGTDRAPQWQEAASELSRAIALNDNKPAPHYQLAQAYKHSANTTKPKPNWPNSNGSAPPRRRPRFRNYIVFSRRISVTPLCAASTNDFCSVPATVPTRLDAAPLDRPNGRWLSPYGINAATRGKSNAAPIAPGPLQQLPGRS